VYRLLERLKEICSSLGGEIREFSTEDFHLVRCVLPNPVRARISVNELSGSVAGLSLSIGGENLSDYMNLDSGSLSVAVEKPGVSRVSMHRDLAMAMDEDIEARVIEISISSGIERRVRVFLGA